MARLCHNGDGRPVAPPSRVYCRACALAHSGPGFHDAMFPRRRPPSPKPSVPTRSWWLNVSRDHWQEALDRDGPQARQPKSTGRTGHD